MCAVLTVAALASGQTAWADANTSTDGVTNVEAGQFVKAGSGAYILPFRAYLTYAGSNTALKAPGRGVTDTPAIPNSIKVRLLSSDGATTATGTIDMNTGEITIDQWYYLNGQPVNGAPAAPGLYLNSKGKKVMITELCEIVELGTVPFSTAAGTYRPNRRFSACSANPNPAALNLQTPVLCCQ